MGIDQVQEIRATGQFHPDDTDEIDGQQRGERAKDEPADETVAQRFLVAVLRQTQHHDRHDERVVGTEQPLETDEEADGDEISDL